MMGIERNPILNRDLTEMIPYSKAKQVLGDLNWIFDFELNLGPNFETGCETIVMGFFRENDANS